MSRYALTPLLAVAALALNVLPAPAAGPASQATSADPGHWLRHAPGAHAASGRHGQRRSLAYFAHLTDPHIADEASPARHERPYGQKPMRDPRRGR
jgi:hypothetical protein